MKKLTASGVITMMIVNYGSMVKVLPKLQKLRTDIGKLLPKLHINKPNDLFGDNGHTITTSGGLLNGNSWENVHTTKTQGELSRTVAKVEKKIYDIFYDQRKREKLERNVDRYIEQGKKSIAKTFSKKKQSSKITGGVTKNGDGTYSSYGGKFNTYKDAVSNSYKIEKSTRYVYEKQPSNKISN